MKRLMSAWACLSLLLLVTPVIAQDAMAVLRAHSQMYRLDKGEPAPEAGTLFNDAAAIRLVEDLRDLDTLRAQVEGLKALVATKEREVGVLQAKVTDYEAAARDNALALALADDRDKRRQEIAELMERAMKALKESNEDLRKTIAETRPLIVRLDKQIESERKRAFWLMLLGPIVGALSILGLGLAF